SKLRLGLDANFSGFKTFGTPTSTSTYSHEINLLFNAWAYRPVSLNNEALLEQGHDPDLESNQNERFNPVMTVNHELRENFSNIFTTNGFVEYEILKNLKYKISGSYTKGLRRTDAFNDENSRTGHELSNYKVNGSRNFIESNRWYVSNQLNYAKTLNKKHYVNAIDRKSTRLNSSHVKISYAVYCLKK